MSIKLLAVVGKKRLLWIAVTVCITILFFIWMAVRHQGRLFAQRTHCVGNLIHIRIAKKFCEDDMGLVNGDTISRDSLEKYLGKPLAQYRCPNGGEYIIGQVGVVPVCTYTNVSYTYNFDWAEFKLERRKWTHSHWRY